MATTRIMPLHTGTGRDAGMAISDIIDYVKNPEKTDGGRLIASYQCDSRTADAEFLLSKRQYKTITGRTQGSDVIAYHFRQSFQPGEVTPEEANRIGQEFAHRFLKDGNAFIVCTHIDRHHVHNHIIWNSTALSCDRKFRNFWGSTKAIRRLSDTICIEHGLSVIENPKRHGKSYNKWLGDKAEPTRRDVLRAAIDAAMEQKPADLAALLTLLADDGYEIKRGKNIALKGKNQVRFIRLSSLGEGYAEADLLAALAGEKSHAPRKKAVVSAPEKISLIIELDAKFRAAKGAGYQQWASVFNAKQMSQTMNYLRENKLLDYAELKEKTAAATARFNVLSAQIKASESRMAEIAVLKTQIINYAKTRTVFNGYKASGYSRKYLAEHESDILLHRAAKKTFNDLGLKSCPPSRACRRNMQSCWRRKKPPTRNIGRPVMKCGSCLLSSPMWTEFSARTRARPRKKKNRSGVDRFCSQASEGCAASSGTELFRGIGGSPATSKRGLCYDTGIACQLLCLLQIVSSVQGSDMRTRPTQN